MPKYKVTLPNGHTYRISSERELSDAEAHQAAVTQAATEPKDPTKVDANEPDTYLGGAWKGFKEGAMGGLKGFGQGLLEAPANMAQGAMDLVTTDPRTTLKNMWEGAKAVPGMVANAGNDPETYGKMVGNLTGQTELGLVAPAAIKPGLRVARDVAGLVADHPYTAFVAGHRVAAGKPGQAALAIAAPYAIKKVYQGLQALVKDEPVPMEGLKLPTRKAPTVEGSLNDALGEMLMEDLKNAKAPGTLPQTMTPAGKPSITPAAYDELMANSPGPTPPAAPVDPIVAELLRRYPHLKDSSRYKVE